MIRSIAPTLALALVMIAGFALPAVSTAQDSTVTYQGQLRLDGEPFTGTANLDFRLFDQLVDGSEVGGAQTRPSWPVEDGLFQVELDFGSAAFDGGDRFLEVRVDGAPLSPRQRVTATPYALLAAGAAAGSIDGVSIDPTEIQLRVVGTCPAGEYVREVNQDGSVVCESASDSGGTVTQVDTGAGLSGGPITDTGTISVASGGIGATQINPGQVQRRVTGTCPAGEHLQQVNQDGSVTCGIDNTGIPGWNLSGNAGTDSTTDFIGTTDSQPLELRTANARSLRIEPSAETFGAPALPITTNTIAGSHANEVTAGIRGATIAGGGAPDDSDPDLVGEEPNRVSVHYGTVGGGSGNRAGDDATQPLAGEYATVGGGIRNTASGDASSVGGGGFSTASGGFGNCAGGSWSWAGGRKAKVRPGSQSGVPGIGCSGVTGSGDWLGDEGTFVWADSDFEDGAFESTGPDQFLVRAAGGVAINTNAPLAPLTVRGEGKWNPDIGNGFGDFHVGNEDYGLAIGVANGPGLGAGAVRLWPKGGNEAIVFTTGASYPDRTLTLSDSRLVGVRRNPTNNAFEVAGNASKSSAGSWLANSDARIKTDVEGIPGALDRLMQVRPVTFRYSQAYRDAHPDLDETRYYNVIAQEFARVFPDAVKGSGEFLPGRPQTPHNEILQVDTHPALITSIAAVQELAVRLEQAEARNAALEAGLSELRAELAMLRDLVVPRVAEAGVR